MRNKSSIIYVVDDNVSVCRALALLLKSHGFKVETFTNAADFLAFKHLKMSSCLVSDIRMPNITGLDLQEVMIQQGFSIPIVFVSGHGDISMSVQAMRNGAVDFLPKPFKEEELLKAIERAISKNKIQNKRQDEINKIKRNIKTLSPRELEVFHFVVQGMLSKQIASKRGIALQTIKVHRSRVMQKMQAKTVTELIQFAQTAGITSSQR